jgi:hypothetical protein
MDEQESLFLASSCIPVIMLYDDEESLGLWNMIQFLAGKPRE